MTTLFAVGVLSGVVGTEVVKETLLPLLTKMATDGVPNIRFNVCKTMQILIPLMDSTIVQARVKPLLSKMLEDKDPDVKYFAQQAWQMCH